MGLSSREGPRPIRCCKYLMDNENILKSCGIIYKELGKETGLNSRDLSSIMGVSMLTKVTCVGWCLHLYLQQGFLFVGIFAREQFMNSYISAFLATFSPVIRPPILALGGVQLPLPVLQWSKLTERT